MNKNPVLSAWTDIHSILRTHKLINLGLILVCISQTFVIAMMYLSDPIVVIKEGKEQRYFSGQRANLPISEEAVKVFVEEFLRLRYEWKELDPKTMKKSLAPIVTDGLNQKLFQLLSHLKNKEFQGKKTSQVIVNVSVNVEQEKVVASFDKLLRIEGIPVPIPTRVSLNIIRGTANSWNPIGLLVNGLMENQSK